MPDDWSPNPTHHRIASEESRDVLREAERFRAYAQAHDRRYANWDAAFTNWLRFDYGRNGKSTDKITEGRGHLAAFAHGE